MPTDLREFELSELNNLLHQRCYNVLEIQKTDNMNQEALMLALETQDFTKRFSRGNITALEDVTLSV